MKSVFLHTGLLLVVILTLSLDLFAVKDSSKYVPFPDSNAVWGMECWQGFQGEFNWVQHYRVGNEDTTIGGQVYSQLFYSRSDLSISEEYIGAYRNDTLLKHVYYVDSADTSERLLYNFSLEVGDTFQIPYPNFACFDTIAIVSSIDSVLVGAKYRRSINSNIAPMIEGLGCQAGLFEFWGSCFEYQCILRCFQIEDTILLGTPTNCDLVLGGMNEDQLNPAHIEIHPNPFSNQAVLTFDNPNNTYTSLLIFNSIGELVREQRLVNSEEYVIQKGNLKSGLHLFRLISDSQPLGSGKLMVSP
ncbi:MAG: T9SS type A sorting domain-containing protein [Flavobacteriales bacterium]|nr:T9SS type A sorting domain-containing protein [Flavobacteriales bacterium]